MPKGTIIQKKALTDGFSSKNADIDNPTKPILDILQKKYKFDDRQIYELNLKKQIVPKGDEFIEMQISAYNERTQRGCRCTTKKS